MLGEIPGETPVKFFKKNLKEKHSKKIDNISGAIHSEMQQYKHKLMWQSLNPIEYLRESQEEFRLLKNLSKMHSDFFSEIS